jgi:transposase
VRRGSPAHRPRVGDARASLAQQAARGSPVQRDPRTVVGAIMWVRRTGSSWREMPEEYGKWESAYRRYELCLREGLWQRILQALGEEALPGPAKKGPN